MSSTRLLARADRGRSFKKGATKASGAIGMEVTVPEAEITAEAREAMAEFVTMFRKKTGIVSLDEQIMAALTNQLILSREALTSPLFEVSVREGMFDPLINDGTGQPRWGIFNGLIAASAAMAAEEAQESIGGGTAYGTPAKRDETSRHLERSGESTGKSALYSLEDLDGYVVKTGVERGSLQVRIDKWQHALRLWSGVRRHNLLGKDMMGSTHKMFETLKRLRREVREHALMEEEWRELCQMGELEELRMYCSPVLFERFVLFEMEPETPWRFSLADFFANVSLSRCDSKMGSGMWKRELGRAMDSFALGCMVIMGLPDLRELEAFRALRRLIVHDTIAAVPDAYVFHVANGSICKVVRRFRFDLPTEKEGKEGLRGHDAFLRVCKEAFAVAAALIPEEGTDIQLLRRFMDYDYYDIRWDKERVIKNGQDDTDSESDKKKKRARETAKADERKVARGVAGGGAGGGGRLGGRGGGNGGRGGGGRGHLQLPRRLCPFHTLGVCGVVDENAGNGTGLFACRTVGQVCVSGLHVKNTVDMTREEARLAVGELRGPALVSKGRAAVEAKPSQAFRQG